MKSFSLQIQASSQSLRLNEVTSFVAEDISGSFAILAGHAAFMTSLNMGLARFCIGENSWQYIALPGGILYFDKNRLLLNCRYYLVDDDYMAISQTFHKQLLLDEEKLEAVKKDFSHMEKELLKRLWRIGKVEHIGQSERLG